MNDRDDEFEVLEAMYGLDDSTINLPIDADHYESDEEDDDSDDSDDDDEFDDIDVDGDFGEAASAKAVRGRSKVSGRVRRRRVNLRIPGGYVPVASVKRGFAITDAEIRKVRRTNSRQWRSLKANGRRDRRTAKRLRVVDRRDRRSTAWMKRRMFIAAKRERRRFYISAGLTTVGTLLGVWAASQASKKTSKNTGGN